MLLIEILTGIATSFLILWLTWMVVEKHDIIPAWLQFKPYNCRTCLTFWLTVGVAVGWWTVGMYATSITTAVMAILNGLTMHLDDKQRFDD